jgi:hypothetical protein
LATVGLAAALAATASTSSFAGSRGWAAAGAGFVAGTIIGAAAANANARYYYGGPYGYYDDSYAYAPAYTYSYGPGYSAYAYAPAYAGPRYYYQPRESAREKHLTSPNY